jgi:predicted house-cleaning noncanonical NTP pyrophosphatase (MazG superfamily)
MGVKKASFCLEFLNMVRKYVKEDYEVLEDTLIEELSDYMDVLSLLVTRSTAHNGYVIHLYNPKSDRQWAEHVSGKEMALSAESIIVLKKVASRLKNETHSKLAKYLRGEIG